MSCFSCWEKMFPVPRFFRNGKIEHKNKNAIGKGFCSKMTPKKLIPVYIESINDFLYFIQAHVYWSRVEDGGHLETPFFCKNSGMVECDTNVRMS